MENILRKIQIGFMDHLSLHDRYILAASDIPVCEIVGKDGYDYYDEACDVMNWLEDSERNHVWWYGGQSYPVFTPIEGRLPFMVFCRGRLPQVNESRIAVVGTRRCDYDGLQKSFEVGLEASINGYCVVSGLAEGCDRAATQGSCAAQELLCGKACPNYAVLGHGIEWDNHRSTRWLFDRIFDCGGAVLSQFAPHANPTRYTFPNRNVLIAAMSEAVVAVQAPLKSGTLITVDHAITMDRDVYVPDAGLGDLVCRRGTDRLKFEGAFDYEELASGWTRVKSAPEQSGKGVRFGTLRYSLC